MRWSVLVVLLFCVPFVCAQPVNDYNSVGSMDISFSLSSQIELLQSGSRPVVDFVLANVSFYPYDQLWQEVHAVSADASNDGSIHPGATSYSYIWERPEHLEPMTFRIDADITNTNVLHLVEDKVAFPLVSPDPYYTQQTEFIDMTPAIEQQALALAAGEDDLYVVTFKVADWVEENIEYDLSSLTAEAVQPSSWVLTHKQGVCDELTNLFISMMRSLNVPARYVSGLAYTNMHGTWGPHAWAEVYFPDVGWVPFDVTYGQYGWIDPSHIKLKEGVDSGDPTIKYLWRSSHVDFIPGEIDL